MVGYFLKIQPQELYIFGHRTDPDAHYEGMTRRES